MLSCTGEGIANETNTQLEGNYMKLLIILIGPGGLLLVVLHLFAVSVVWVGSQKAK
jgi:hypothetical protein